MITVEDVAQQMARTRVEVRPEVRSMVDRLAANLTDRDPDMWAQYEAALADVMDAPGLKFALYEVDEDRRYLPHTQVSVGDRIVEMATHGHQRAERGLIDAGYDLVGALPSYVDLGGKRYCVILTVPAA